MICEGLQEHGQEEIEKNKSVDDGTGIYVIPVLFFWCKTAMKNTAKKVYTYK